MQFLLEQAINAQKGLHSFFNLGTYHDGKQTLYPWHRRLDGPQGQCGRARKVSTPPVFDPRTVHPVAVTVPTKLSQPRYIHIPYNN